MFIDREAFVKNWWSNYQVQYALIESPERRIQFLDSYYLRVNVFFLRMKLKHLF